MSVRLSLGDRHSVMPSVMSCGDPGTFLLSRSNQQFLFAGRPDLPNVLAIHPLCVTRSRLYGGGGGGVGGGGLCIAVGCWDVLYKGFTVCVGGSLLVNVNECLIITTRIRPFPYSAYFS